MPDSFFDVHADDIAEAAESFKGHVTNGSLEEILKVMSTLHRRRVRILLHELAGELERKKMGNGAEILRGRAWMYL